MKASKAEFKTQLKAKGTEVFLWILFLLLCGLLGYFHGVKPSFKISDYIIKPPQIEILTVSQIFFPPEIVTELENSSHTRIHVTKISSWKELSVQLIATPAPDILLIPSHWAQTLNQEGLLNSESLKAENFFQFLASDFIPENKAFLPLTWTQLNLLNVGEKTQTISFVDDADLFVNYLENLKAQQQDTSFLQHTFVLTSVDEWLKESGSIQDFILSSSLRSHGHSEWKKTNYPDAIYFFGAAVSKNNIHLKESLRILKSYVSFELQAQILGSVALASALKSVEESQLAADKKPSSLRGLNFKNSVLIRSKEKDAAEKAKALTGLDFSI